MVLHIIFRFPRWSCIKQRFIKYRKRMSTGEPQAKDWPVYDEMYSWLDEHVQKRISHRSRIEMWGQICSNADGQIKTDADVDGTNCEDSTDNTCADSVWSELPTEEPVDGSPPNNKAGIVIIRKVAKHAAVGDTESEPTPRKRSCDLSKSTPRNGVGVVRTSVRTSEKVNEMATDVRAPTILTASNTNVSGISNLREVFAAPPVPISTVATATDNETAVDLNVNTERLQNAISKCVSMAEKCAQRQRSQDPDEVFGTLIASMVRELPAERRRSARVRILDVVGDLLEKLAGDDGL